jgi:hypothetical protein
MAIVHLTGVPAAAQPAEFAQTPMRLGVLRIQPQIVSSIGVDTNIFNDAATPRQDTILHIAPEAAISLRLGRARVEGQASAAGDFFRQYSGQSSLNPSAQATLELPLARIAPYVRTAVAYTRERTGFEIDVRPRRLERTIAAGADVRVGARTTLGVAARRSDTAYDDTAVFRGTALRLALNRETQGLTIALRYAITTQTTAIVNAERLSDAFPFAPSKDADSVRLTGGFDFKPRAVLRGGFNVGYMQFRPVAGITHQFRGVVGAADLAYVLRGVTRLSVRGARDVAYSFEPVHPYYVVTSVTGAVTHRLGERWELNAMAGSYRLRYMSLAGLPNAVPPAAEAALAPEDDGVSFGGGIGYYLSRAALVTMLVERIDRRSPVAVRAYGATRTRAGVTVRF